jgi:hypothetical protein
MSWSGDENAIHDDVAAEISALTEKTILVDADLVLIEDSAGGNVKRKAQVGNLPGGGGGGGGGIGPAFSGARMTKSTTQDNITASTITAVTWDGTDYDTGGYADLTGEQFTIPEDGYYRLTAGVGIQQGDGLSEISANIRLNATTNQNVLASKALGAADLDYQILQLEGSITKFYSEGDDLEVIVLFVGISTADVRNSPATFFEIQKVDEGALISGWSPILDHKPGAADTPDDEFDSTTLDGKWTAVSGSSGTVDLAETGEVTKYDLTTRPGVRPDDSPRVVADAGGQ